MQRRTSLDEAPVIETDRLTLRPFALGDFERSMAITNDPRVHLHLGGPLEPATKWEKFLRSPAWWKLLGYGFWMAADRETGEVVGELGYGEFRRQIDPPLADMPEMGWIFAHEAHGRGLASEALEAWGDGIMPGPYQCIIATGNAGSLRLAARHGFAEVRQAAWPGPGGGEVAILERATR
jgi:RimJ/RimL family protein N-acetyltransferase